LKNGIYQTYYVESAIFNNSEYNYGISNNTMVVNPLPLPPTIPNPPSIPTPVPTPVPTTQNNETGNYPMNNSSGNVANLNTSDYYNVSGSMFQSLNNTAMGITGFLLYPVNTLTDTVNQVNDKFSSTTQYVNQSFLGTVIAPASQAVPAKIVGVYCYIILLKIIAFLLRYR
jgi:hypothetical protein